MTPATHPRSSSSASSRLPDTPLDRAIERATAAGVHVAGLGRFKAHPQRRFALVTSASRSGAYHVISISDVRLSCDCEAGRRGRLCVHQAATSMYLTAQAARLRRFEEAVERALREARGEAEADDAEDRAPLRSEPGWVPHMAPGAHGPESDHAKANRDHEGDGDPSGAWDWWLAGGEWLGGNGE